MQNKIKMRPSFLFVCFFLLARDGAHDVNGSGALTAELRDQVGIAVVFGDVEKGR